MKQNIIMIVILIALFFFGLLIYDFSDELDDTIVRHDWYRLEEQKMTIISFKDGKFSYYYEENNLPVTLYELCLTYRFNRSINVIKLNCSVKGNKLYISEFDAEKLIITIDGEEKMFYHSSVAATEANFILNNEMTRSEFEELMNFDLTRYSLVTIDEVNALYKTKGVKFVAIVNQGQTINNALNLLALYNYTNKINKDIQVLVIEDLSNNELGKLNKLNSSIASDLKDYDFDKIPLFGVGDKKFELVTNINVKTYSEAKNYRTP